MIYMNEICKCSNTKVQLLTTAPKNHFTRLGIIINKQHKIYGCSICKQFWYIYIGENEITSLLAWTIAAGIIAY